LFIGYVSKISFEEILFSGKTMDTQHQHTGHRIFPGFSIIHANHPEDLRQVAVGWIKAHPLQVLETLHAVSSLFWMAA